MNKKNSNQKLVITLTLISLFFIHPVIANECDFKIGKIVSYEFNDIPLKSIMMLVGTAAKKEMAGLDLLGDKIVTVSANKVNVVKFAEALLLVNGFALNREKESWVITKM